MKNLHYVLLVLPLVLGCSIKGDSLTGNNKIEQETRNVSSFHEINNQSVFDVVLTQKSGTELLLEGDENLLEKVVTKVKDGVLMIDTEPNLNIKSFNKMVVYVPGQNLDAISLDGTGDITGEGLFQPKTLDLDLDGTGDLKISFHSDTTQISLDGTGDMNLELNVQQADISLDGTGGLTLKGGAQSAMIELDGTGDVMANAFQVGVMQLEVDGTGDADVYAKKQIAIDYDGTGDVNVAGNAEVIKIINDGTGQINFIK